MPNSTIRKLLSTKQGRREIEAFFNASDAGALLQSY